MGVGADGAADGAGGDLGAGLFEADAVAGELGVVAGELEAEGGGLGVDGVTAADGGGVFEFEGALLEGGEDAVDAGQQEVGRLGELNG